VIHDDERQRAIAANPGDQTDNRRVLAVLRYLGS
jgi:hypothetical protein